MKIRPNDTIKVLQGKDAGRTGIVQAVSAKKNVVLVKGLNLAKKHIKNDNQGNGGIVEIPRPINVSKLMVVCPACNKPTRIGVQVKEGKRVRICKKCGKEFTTAKVSEAVAKKPTVKKSSKKKVSSTKK